MISHQSAPPILAQGGFVTILGIVLGVATVCCNSVYVVIVTVCCNNVFVVTVTLCCNSVFYQCVVTV